MKVVKVKRVSTKNGSPSSLRQVFHCPAHQITSTSAVRVILVWLSTEMPSPVLPGPALRVRALPLTGSPSSHCSRTLRPRSTCLLRTTAPPWRPCPRRVLPFREWPVPMLCLALPLRRQLSPTTSTNNMSPFAHHSVPSTVTPHGTPATLLTHRIFPTPHTATFTVAWASPPPSIEPHGKGNANFAQGDALM